MKIYPVPRAVLNSFFPRLLMRLRIYVVEWDLLVQSPLSDSCAHLWTNSFRRKDNSTILSLLPSHYCKGMSISSLIIRLITKFSLAKGSLIPNPLPFLWINYQTLEVIVKEAAPDKNKKNDVLVTFHNDLFNLASKLIQTAIPNDLFSPTV